MKHEEPAKTEEEEEERFRHRRSAWNENRKGLLEEVHRKVFAGWTDSDWAALDKAWRRFAL